MEKKRIQRIAWVFGIVMLLQSVAGWGQTHVDLRTQAKSAEFSSFGVTTPFTTGAVLPLACSPGQMFFLTGAPAGQNVYGCASENVWTVEAGTGGGFTMKESGALVGVRPILDVTSGLGILASTSDTGQEILLQNSVDTSFVLTKSGEQTGQTLFCDSESTGNPGVNYECSMAPTLNAYVTGMVMRWRPDVNGTGAGVTLNIDSLGAKAVFKADGTTTLQKADAAAGQLYMVWYDGTAFRIMNSGTTSTSVTTPATPIGAVNTLFWPFGSDMITSGSSSLLSSANQVAYLEIAVPYPGLIVNHLSVFTYGGAGDVGNMAWGFANASCQLLASGTSATVQGTGNQQGRDFAFSPGLTLNPGKYFLVFSSDNSASRFFSASGSGYAGYLMNLGETAASYHMFTGSNPSTTTSNTITLPTSCGTRTALSSGGGTALPAISLH